MTTYFDYSTMIRWEGAPTGIPRTEYCLAQEILETDSKAKLVVINDDLQAFHHLDRQAQGFSIGDAVEFSKDDILISAGANWAFTCYVQQIQSLKTIGARYFQLFYDLIPYLYPYYYKDGTGFGDYIGNWTKQTLALCDGAYAISNCTKRDLAKFAQLSDTEMDQIEVVRLGEDFVQETRGNHPRRFSYSEEFLLSVGTLEIRKNQTCLLQAYRILAERHGSGISLPKLVLVGRPGWIDGNVSFQVANDRLLKDLVQVVTDASDAELTELYQHSLFTLFPAIYEGWGLPVAESLRYGKPCICSDTSSMLEIAPSLTLFASPYDANAWADQIESLLLNRDKLASCSALIGREYRPTTWKSTAEHILGHTQKLIGDKI